MVEAKYLGLTVNELAKIASDLDAENDRLREISADMLKCIKAITVLKALCWKCPHHRDNEPGRGCVLERDARELGIEVGS